MDNLILGACWIATAALLVILINRKNLIQAILSFLFMQVPSWLFGALVVQGGLIEYPVGFLQMVYKASFSFEFFIFPAVSAVFNVYFPQKRRWFAKLIYTLSFPTIITITEVQLEKHTHLIKYLHWSWYWSFLTLTFTLLLSYSFCLWFFKKVKTIRV
ncbi:CBO0543 family protein [Paenibacillus oryzisoli]|uniref:CBO0543 family protein n=1 Tax=Paenibacillus oryzisoli TaxID=1850517 RepID=UPI003D2DFEA0